MSDSKTQASWSEEVAALGVDMLVDHGLIQREDFERATKIVAEEILVRLRIGDYPPAEESSDRV
jgi:predicted RNA-binding protein associated with RNAse of E/G family